MTDIDSTQNSDNAGSTESEPNFRRKYEKTIEAERARADAAEAENKILMRDKTFRSAGLDPDDARVKYFVKGYEGDLDVDAIRMEAEAAGFLNAIEVKVQPDTADWDAGDIRYNVLRWTSSPNPPFGGYGPSFVNPKTGEIIGADIMLEWVYITNRIKYDFLYDAQQSVDYFNENYCSASHEFQKQNIFGGNCIDLLNLGEEMKKEMG